MITLIDLLKLNYLDEIVIDEEVEIPNNYLENTDIVSLTKVKTKGNITLDSENNYIIKLDVNASMKLHDSITFKEIPYYFTFKIEETLENSLKTLDLIEFLWQYIILEVPLRFTTSKIDSIETDNYRIISEEEYSKKNNPFKDFFEREE